MTSPNWWLFRNRRDPIIFPVEWLFVLGSQHKWFGHCVMCLQIMSFGMSTRFNLWHPQKIHQAVKVTTRKKHAKNCQSYFDCTGPGTHLLVIYVVSSLSHSIHGTGTNAYSWCWYKCLQLVNCFMVNVEWIYVTPPQMDPTSMVSVVFCQADIFDQFSLKVTSTGRVLCFLSTLGEEAVADGDCLTAISRQVQR